MKLSGLLLSCAILACAARPPLAPRVSLDSRFTLAPGAAAVIEGTSVQVRFDRVVSDSRCPTDTQCIQAGDAVVRMTVLQDGATKSDDLYTGAGGTHSTSFGQLTITLEDLSPRPVSSRELPSADYRATLRASR
jgi:hypothetical protein